MTFDRNNKKTVAWYTYRQLVSEAIYDFKVAHMPWESPTYTKDSKLSSRRYKINLQRKVLHANW